MSKVSLNHRQFRIWPGTVIQRLFAITTQFSVVCCILFVNTTVSGQLKNTDRIPAPIRELLQTYCLDCHDADDGQAGLNLSHFKTVGQIREERDTWLHVQRRVLIGSMPPLDFGEMDAEDRASLTQWIDRALHDLDCSEIAHAGTVTARRLNRVEYRNTIRDLLLVDYEPAESFLGDDVGYGFDNIGDVLSLPPAMLEKYLSAAEAISQRIIIAPEDLVPIVTPMPIERWKFEGNGNKDGQLAFYSNGTATYDFQQAKTDEVIIRMKVRGQQAGDEPCKMTLTMNRNRLKTFEIHSHEEIETIEFKTKISKGNRRLQVSFDNDFYNPQAADPARRDRNLYVLSVEFVPVVAETPEPSEAQRNFLFETPRSTAEIESTQRRIIQYWSSLIFRRPTDDSEVQRLLALASAARQDGSSFERSMQFVLQAMLISPKFLYRIEQPPPVDGTAQPLSSYELATNLAFFLTCAAPDAQLLSAAHQNDLQQLPILRREAARLLMSERADRMIENFSEQWLQLRNLRQFEPDTKQFADVDRALLDDMKRETLLFCQDIFRRDGSVLELLTAEHTFVNERLAKHYGLSEIPPSENQFVRVDLAGTARGGILTHASILTVTSNPTRTSPVKRGRWILETLLNEAPPPAPPEVMPLEEQQLTGTFREQLAQHRENPSCASCHNQMDPLGFALENFDAVGRWRVEEAGTPINASGELPSGETIVGAAELRQVLMDVKRTAFVRCLTEKMLTYALGRGLRYSDQCTVNEIVKRLEANDYRMSELIYGIIESEPFRIRQRLVQSNQ